MRNTAVTSDDAAAAVRAFPTVHGHVSAVRRLTPSLLEVTLAGFHGYPLGGGDEYVYVLVSPAPGGIASTYDMAAFMARVAGDPVRGAYYTVRRARPDAGEIDLWVVDHRHPGSVAAWMSAAEAGAPVALWGPRRGFQVPHGARHVLLVADETGLAAVAALLEAMPLHCGARVILECAGPDDRPPLPARHGVDIVWIDRGDECAGITNHLLVRVADVVASAPDAAFGAGESRQISAVRRHLRDLLGMPSAAVEMTGYWRREVPS